MDVVEHLPAVLHNETGYSFLLLLVFESVVEFPYFLYFVLELGDSLLGGLVGLEPDVLLFCFWVGFVHRSVGLGDLGL